MKCHYEVLDVPRTAELAEIKSSYKKLALKWHPDKNLGNVENAQQEFLLIQQAYEVLSDPQERAWYDNHREQILRGSASGFEDNSLDVYQYFTATCFKGYGDDEGGFYHVYGDVFGKIAGEEVDFMAHEEFCSIPNFGNSESGYDECVKPFYDYWSNYYTKKTYVWVDPYDIKDLRDRRTLKLAEKENKKVRLKAKKERNEEIRALVRYVRKRDKRVQAHAKLMESKVLENREKQEKLRRQKIIERNQELLNSSNQAEWTKFDHVKEELENIEKHLTEMYGDKSSSEGEESEDNNLYCVACNKVFKTEKSFRNHEVSKKHLKLVEQLKSFMEDEEQTTVNGTNSNADKSDTESSSELEAPITEMPEKRKKKTKKSKSIKTDHVEDDNSFGYAEGEPSDLGANFDFNSSKKSSKRKSQKLVNSNKRETKCFEDVVTTHTEEQTELTESNAEELGAKLTEEKTVRNSKKKGKQKNCDESVIDENIDKNHCCVTCKSSFGSKNKLFEHLKKTGHSVYLSQKEPRNGRGNQKSKIK